MDALGAQDSSDPPRTDICQWLWWEVGTQHKGRDKDKDLCTCSLCIHPSLQRFVQSHPHLSGSSPRQLWPGRWERKYFFVLKIFCLELHFYDSCFFFLPDSSSEERIKCIQPVMHLFVISGLEQYPAVLCAHSKRVGGLLERTKTLLHRTWADEGIVDSLVNHRPSASPAGPRCTPPGQRTGWGWPAPRRPSPCCRCRRTAAARQRSASPSRWCVAPGSVCNPSSTQWDCKNRSCHPGWKQERCTESTKRAAVAGLPDSNLLDVRDESAYPRFGFRASVDGLLDLCVPRGVRTGAGSTRARQRGSGVQKIEASWALSI